MFRRDVKTFIARRFFAFNDPTFGAIRGDFPVNLPALTIQGAEAQFTAFADMFDSLPEWAKAFGVQGNITYLQQV